MKKLDKYTLEEIHTVCAGMNLSYKNGSHVIVTLQTAKSNEYFALNTITVGYTIDKASGYITLGKGSWDKEMILKCEEKLHEHFNSPRIETKLCNRLDLISV